MDWSTVVSAFFGSALGVLVSIVTVVYNENVKTRLAGTLWERQELFRLKQQSYSRLIETAAEMSLISTHLCNTGLPDDDRQEHERKEATLMVEMSRAVRVARLYLGPEALDSMERYFQAGAALVQGAPALQRKGATNLLQQLQMDLIGAARKEMKL